MRVLITGGAGFIGSNLARMAADVGWEVIVLDDLSTGSLNNLQGLPCRFVQGSVLDPEALMQVTSGVDSIVHLAARASVPRSLEDPIRTHEVNATGTLRVLEAARLQGVQHAIVASSSSVYGSNPEMPKRELTWVGPLSPYAASKLATEQYALAYQNSYGLGTLAFRFFNVYGPNQPAGHAYAAVVPSFIDAMMSGTRVHLYGTGHQTRDFTFVDTLCRVLIDAVARKVTSAMPINLAYGTQTSLLQLLEQIAGLLGVAPEVVHHPARSGDVMHSSADNSALRRLFPDLDPVGLSDGLRRTVQWFESTR